MNYYFPAISYISLRKALARGIAAKELKMIKKFHCNCEKHNMRGRTVIVTDEINEFTIKKCRWRAEEGGDLAINAEGEILISAYRFYSGHPEWKVRAAVAEGLSKLNTKESIDLLINLMTDAHYGVANAAIQALEKIGSEQVIDLLRNFAPKHNEKRVQRLIERAIRRVTHFVTSNQFVKQAVNKLLNRNLTRKVPDQKDKGNKILVPRKFFSGIFTEKLLKKRLGSLDVAAHAHQLSNQKFIFKGEKLLVKGARNSSSDTKKNKINYQISLFFKDKFLVDRIQNNLRPITGEVYWSVTDAKDPKTTRPVLVLKPMTNKLDEFLVVPLTSDISNPKSKLLVTIDGSKSCVQMSRQKIIHKSMLLNKYGSISQKDLEKILASKELGVLPVQKIKKYIAQSTKRFNRTKRSRYGKNAIDITSEVYSSCEKETVIAQKPNKSEGKVKLNHAITLGQFFKLPPNILPAKEQIKNRNDSQKKSSAALKPARRK